MNTNSSSEEKNNGLEAKIEDYTPKSKFVKEFERCYYTKYNNPIHDINKIYLQKDNQVCINLYAEVRCPDNFYINEILSMLIKHDFIINSIKRKDWSIKINGCEFEGTYKIKLKKTFSMWSETTKVKIKIKIRAKVNDEKRVIEFIEVIDDYLTCYEKKEENKPNK